MEAVVGGSGADATEVIFPKAANKLVGTKFKVVLGYPGSTEILLAMERGEVEGFCGIGWTFLKLRKGDWLRDGKVNILYQMSLEKHPELPHVPAIIDHVKTADDRKVFEFLFAPQEMGRPFFAPPGVPAERVQALRAAFAQTLKDRAVPGRGREAGRRGAARRRRAHPAAGGAHLRLPARDDRARQGGSGMMWKIVGIEPASRATTGRVD